MPGIIVGIDGSPHSQRALEVAITEAALHHAPLTVLTVHQVLMGSASYQVAHHAHVPVLIVPPADRKP